MITVLYVVLYIVIGLLIAKIGLAVQREIRKDEGLEDRPVQERRIQAGILVVIWPFFLAFMMVFALALGVAWVMGKVVSPFIH